MNILSGIRVLELSSTQVGPAAGGLLGLMGAEVIKIESRRKLELARILPAPGETFREDPDTSPEFNDWNLNKIGICLNLKQPQGVEIMKRLVKISDVILENYSSGTMYKLGLGYEVLKGVKPDIIMISASGSGSSGPEAGIRAIAPVFGALSGLGDMTGYPDGRPSEIRMSADCINAFMLCFSILVAIWHWRKTGQGQFIDYSSWEGLCCVIGDSFMDYTMNRRVQSRNGNRDDIMAPHNCYRCQGEDRWVSIAIATEEEWQAFCNAIGNPELIKDERFSNVYSRWQNQEELDKLVGEWTIKHTHYEVMEILQKAGVAAVPSFTGEDLVSDPHLAAREFTEIVEHPRIGATPVIRTPWRFSVTQAQIARHAPLLGEHNNYVYGELLGMDDQEITSLEEAKVFW